MAEKKKYPYIERNRSDSKTQIHICEEMYIEIDPNATPQYTVIEHGKPNAGKKTSLSFLWEYFNLPNEKIMRCKFGQIDMYSNGVATRFTQTKCNLSGSGNIFGRRIFQIR